jgi:hypothetical protein
MFVLNAELRKWGFDQLNFLTYNCYSHPDITPSGFEPKGGGETLAGLVGGPCLASVDNVEEMRTNFGILMDLYEDDSDYGTIDFREAWFKTAYPESESGIFIVFNVPPSPIFSLIGANFLRPRLQEIQDGDFIRTTDLHWLGGSGVLFDIDVGEVAYQPFPFPRESFFFAPSTDGIRFRFGPVYPVIQTTAGALPSIDANRFQTDIAAGTLKAESNFDAQASGLVQIDGYVLLAATTMELVQGNDNNFDQTLTGVDDYTDHIQGIREVRDGVGDPDNTARCFRTPSASPTGLFRLITYNQKVNVPDTAIASGYVSIWPQGDVRKANTGAQIRPNFIDGQQLIPLNDGTFKLDPTETKGVHVLDDAIWIAGPNDAVSSGTFDSRGLTTVSPHDGSFVYYRPAERVLATSGNIGPGPGIFGVHLGLELIGSDVVRVSKQGSEFNEVNVDGDDDRVTTSIYFQLFDKTSLDHTEVQTDYVRQGDTVFAASFGSPGFTGGMVSDGTKLYVWREFGVIHRFTTGFAFDGSFTSPIARRRHFGNGQLLYTVAGNIQVGDPLLALPGGSASGIGKWSVFSEPADINGNPGIVTHDSAKVLRGEVHFGDQNPARVRIHHIFDVTGSSTVRSGTWMIIQFDTDLFLARIVEQASQWLVVESIDLTHTPDAVIIFDVPDDFPYEGIKLDID